MNTGLSTHFMPRHALLPLEKASMPRSSSRRARASASTHRSGRNERDCGNSRSSWCVTTVDIPTAKPRGMTCRTGFLCHSPR